QHFGIAAGGVVCEITRAGRVFAGTQRVGITQACGVKVGTCHGSCRIHHVSQRRRVSEHVGACRAIREKAVLPGAAIHDDRHGPWPADGDAPAGNDLTGGRIVGIASRVHGVEEVVAGAAGRGGGHT
ncbi:MAG: hypothetical protein RL281_1050, partial [Pseudomonadota bacterium]